MARYNAWQNNQLMDVVNVMDQDDLDLERGAFFGSIQKTLSHLMWGDKLWMARFDVMSETPIGGLTDHVVMWPTKSEWSTERLRCDACIRAWAEELSEADLAGNLTWAYSDTKLEVTRPLAFCITHFLNHQTHHRGQVHAMLTAAGQSAPVSDLSYLPEDA